MFLLHSRKPDDLLLTDAVIKENEISLLHRAKIVSRLEIAHARPRRAPIFQQVAPRICLWFLLHQPTLLCHAPESVAARISPQRKFPLRDRSRSIKTAQAGGRIAKQR